MWSTAIASPPFFGFKRTRAPSAARNHPRAPAETAARHTSVAAATDASAVALQVGAPRLMKLFGKTASIPTVSQSDTAIVRTLEIGAPGAKPSNTELHWDDAQKQLWVGVWCGKRPESLTLPLRFPIPELAWLRTFRLPEHAGQHAQAWVRGNQITVQVPTASARNVIPLRGCTAAEPKYSTSGLSAADRYPALTAALAWLGAAVSAALCLPVFLLSLFLFGFALLPFLALIGVGIIASTGGSPTAPPARPRLPSADAAALPIHQAQAA